MKTVMLAWFVTCSGLALSLAPSALADDTVRTKDGQAQQGKIKSEDYAVLQFEAAKKKLDIPWDQVDSITYEGGEKIDDAMKTLSAGDAVSASQILKSLADDKKLRPVLHQRALFCQAAALYRAGQMDEANAAADRLRTEFPAGRYVVDVTRLGVEAALAKPDAAAAQAIVDKAGKDGKAAGLPAGFDTEMKLLGARVAELSGKLDKAAADYRAVAAMKDTRAALVAEGQIGAARCDQAGGKVDDAEKAYRAIVTQDLPARALAQAWNGIGDILLEKGKKARSSDAILESVFAYLRGVVQYTPSASEPSSEYERSMAGAATAFQFLADLETADDAKNQYRQRSNDRWAELKKSFPNSKFLTQKK